MTHLIAFLNKMENRYPDYIQGKFIRLRPATMADRKSIYQWLALSDLTPMMLGAPQFPDNPVPTWEEFIHDYAEHFFDGTRPMRGRCFVIEYDGIAIGQVNHDRIYYDDHSTELDIWLANSSHAGKGYSTDALIALCEYLKTNFACTRFIIAPSLRNTNAISAYEKAGFHRTEIIPEWFVPDYTDTVVMIKELSV